MPNVTYIISGEKKTVEGKEGENLLKIALDNEVQIEHACGGNGYCTTCMVKVVENPENLEGYTEQEGLMGVEEGSGNRLSCQAVVKGDVVVKIED